MIIIIGKFQIFTNKSRFISKAYNLGNMLLINNIFK